MPSARRLQQRESPKYGEAIEMIEIVRPVEAAIVRRYVGLLRAEAAQARVQCSLLESQLRQTGGSR